MERTLKILHDKRSNRIAIHDAKTGELIHIFYPLRSLENITPDQWRECEIEAIRDFQINGNHNTLEDEDEPGW